jgi:hypothetical protein
MIREIITAEQGFLQIRLPEEFIGKLIEVIAFPIADHAPVNFPVKPALKRITVVSVKNKSYKFNREELYDR